MFTKACPDSLFRGGLLNRNCRHCGGQARDGVQVVIEPDNLDVKLHAYVHKCSFLEGRRVFVTKKRLRTAGSHALFRKRGGSSGHPAEMC